MLKQLLVWAFICAAAPLAYPYEPDVSYEEAYDTTEISISARMLDEIVVTAAPVVKKVDRRIIRPDRYIRESSADAIDLLRKLQLSRITINPLTNAITATGGGDVVFCINGVEATAGQVNGLAPQDILRIEYHDNPGVRYAGASVVIDYITDRHNSGGRVSLDAFGAFASGRYASIDHLSAQYDRGRSVWNVSAGYMGQRKDKWIRDYDESWNYPGASLTRHESGMPVTVGGSGLESTLNYNYLHPSGNMLNVRLGFDFNDVPDQEEGDRRTILQTSGSETPVTVVEHTEERSYLPGLNLFYLHKFSESNSVIFDVRGSYMRSRMEHDYSEDGEGEHTRVDGDKYSMRFLAEFEHTAGVRRWNVGVSGNRILIDNTYRQDNGGSVRLNQSELAIAGEYSDRFGDWGVMGNLKTTYKHLSQHGQNTEGIFILPSVSLSWRPSDRWFLRYSASIDHMMPSAAEISDIEQPIQTGMSRRGNPALKPFRVTKQSFTTSFESRYVSLEALMEYHNEYSPVMESVLFEDGIFVRTFFNQRYFRRLTGSLSVTLRPWSPHLAVSISPTLNRYFSRGIDYSHCHSIFRVGINVDFTYGHWLAYARIMSGPANRMYGEEIIEEKDMNQIMVGYKQSGWSLHIGVFNAFMNDYWMETRNLSALAPYTSKAHCGRSSSYMAVKLNLALDFGRKGRSVEMPDTKADNDAGILTGTK